MQLSRLCGRRATSESRALLTRRVVTTRRKNSARTRVTPSMSSGTGNPPDHPAMGRPPKAAPHTAAAPVIREGGECTTSTIDVTRAPIPPRPASPELARTIGLIRRSATMKHGGQGCAPQFNPFRRRSGGANCRDRPHFVPPRRAPGAAALGADAEGPATGEGGQST